MRILEKTADLLSITAGELEQWRVVLGVGMPVILLAAAVYLIVKNAEQVVLLAGKLGALIRHLALHLVKIGTERDIRGLIVKANKRLKIANEDAVLVDELKIDWAKSENVRAYIDEDRVIVRMRSSSNPSKNFVNAVTAYVSTGLLPKIKRYIRPELVNAMSLLTARNIVIFGNENALEYYDKTLLRPILDEYPQIKKDFQMLSVLDDYGMFYSILLREYSRAGMKVYPKLSDSLFTEEADGLLRFLYQVAAGRGLGSEQMAYESFYFSVRIMMTVNFNGARDFTRCGRQIVEWSEKGNGAIYVLASAGDEQQVRGALRRALEESDRKIMVSEHVCRRGTELDRVCYHCFEVRPEDKAALEEE